MDHHTHQRLGAIMDQANGRNAPIVAAFLISVGLFCSVFSAYVSDVRAADDSDLSFGAALTPTMLHISIPLLAPVDYKTQRIRDIKNIIKNEYPTLVPHTDILIAHLHSENGAMNEDNRGDHGCSFGIIQLNVCSRFGAKSADSWLSRHPAMKQWDTQVRYYLDEMRDAMKKTTINDAIGNYNPGAYSREIRRAYADIPIILSAYQS